MSRKPAQENSQNTGVATNKQFTVNDVPSLLENVNKQISSIRKNLPETTPILGTLDGFGRVEEIKTLDMLIKARSSVRMKAKVYAEECALINESTENTLKLPPFRLNSHSEKAWLEVIDARIILVGNETQLKKLQEIKKTLEDNLSAEAKLANDLARISRMVTSEDEEEL